MLIGFISGCDFPATSENTKSHTEATARPIVYATSFVVADFARELSGDNIELQLVIPETSNSIDWKPALDDVRRIQSADLLLLNGAGYEPWLQTLSLPKSRLVDTSAGYTDQLIAIQNSVTHQHGPKGRDAGGPKVWATWLDPELATAQLRVIEGRLVRLKPDSASSIAANAALLANQLDKLNTHVQQLQKQTAELQVTVIVDGPFYDYLIRRLGWKLRPASTPGIPTNSIDPPPDASLTLCFINRAENSPNSDTLRQTMKSAGVPIVEIDLCESLPTDSDSCVQAFESNLKRIEAAVQQITK